MKNSTVRGYKVQGCGYYQGGEDKTAEFGTLSSVMMQMYEWVQKKENNGDTITYGDPEKHNRILCFDIKYCPKNCSYLLCLWHELITNDKGAVGLVNLEGSLGGVPSKMKSTKKGMMPGYPSYYYILPEESLILAIKADIKTPIESFRRYIKGFMGTVSPNVKRIEKDGKIQSIFVDPDNPNDGKDLILYPKLLTNLFYNTNNVNFLKEHRDKISEVVLERTVSQSIVVKSLWNKLCTAVPLGQNNFSTEKRKYRFSVKYEPNEIELKSLIKNGWTQSDNVGFVIEGRIYWLGTYDNIDKISHELNDDDEICNDKLFDAVNAKKETFLLKFTKVKERDIVKEKSA